MNTATKQLENRVPAAAELVRRARSLLPILTERATADDAARRVSARTIAEMKEAGLFSVLQPRRWGGLEMDPSVFFSIQLILAEGSMSAAWIFGVQGAHPFLLALFEDRAAQDVWAIDSSVLTCASLMPAGTATQVKGGFRLSGRWQYLSGCDHCDWVFLGGMVAAEKSALPDRRIFLLPRRDVEILDTWHVAGLKATGSHDAVIKDAFIPDYRSIGLVDLFACKGPGQLVNTAPLYRVPFAQIFFHGVTTAAIGALQGMLDAFRTYAASRGTRTSGDPVAQLICAEAAATIDEAKTILHRNLQNLVARSEHGEVPTLAERIQYKFEASYAVERVSLLAARIFKAAGSAALYDGHPFGRMLADINAGRQHIANNYESNGRNWGATMLGVGENRDPML